MRGMQINLQGFGLVSSSEAKWKREETCNEPISVLDKRRSPSPSTSTSTLSSSFAAGDGGGGGGGSGSTDNTAGVVAGSGDSSQQKWPVSAAVTESSAGGGGRKDDWATELQPIPSGLEGSGGERYGLGLEYWETLLSESGQDQSLLRWISGDVEETSFSLKQLLQSTNPNEIAENADHGSSFAPISTESSTGTTMANMTPNLCFNGGSSGLSSNGNENGKVGSISPNSSSETLNCEVPNIGLNTITNISNSQNSIFNNLPLQLPNGLNYQQQQFENPDGKPQILNQQVFLNQELLSKVPQIPQNQNPFPASLYNKHDHHNHLLQPQPKRQNLGISDSDPRSQIPKVPFFNPQMRLPPPSPNNLQQKPLMVPKLETVTGGGSASEQMATTHHHYQQQKQVIYDQLYKAAELIMAGNFSHAQGILARLNHQLSPFGKPFQRAAFYFKEALQLSLLMNNPAATSRNPTPFDAMFKMGAYKAFSEVSPLIQFMNFTSNQAILEALDEAERVHIIDFDIGFGAQWASFMQEFCGRNRGSINPSLKITAFASPSTHHPLELGLMHENLTQFANDIGVNFELEVVNFDSFDPSSYTVPLTQSSDNEAIAVNLPIWACSSHLSALPSLLGFIKQLSPKIMVSLEGGFEWADLPFSHHLLHSLQYYEVLLDSIDASNVTSDISNRIEKFLFLPKIENVVLGRLGLTTPQKMPHWKALFASAGFSPVPFSNFSETQGEYVVKRNPYQGFHVEKRQSSLMLSWQRRELVSASAWRC